MVFLGSLLPTQSHVSVLGPSCHMLVLQAILSNHNRTFRVILRHSSRAVEDLS